jgi:hypothetical protein
MGSRSWTVNASINCDSFAITVPQLMLQRNKYFGAQLVSLDCRCR